MTPPKIEVGQKVYGRQMSLPFSAKALQSLNYSFGKNARDRKVENFC